MEKCTCIKTHRAWDKNIDIKSGSNLLFSKIKIKLNKKTGQLREVRPTQMGDWHFSIFDLSNNHIYSCGEDWFNVYFSPQDIVRQEKINSIIS